MHLKMGKKIHLKEYETDSLAEDLNAFFDRMVDVERIKVGNRQTIDTLGEPKKFAHPKTWNKQTDDQKNVLLDKKEFGQRLYFIYEGNPLFPEYTVEKKSTYKEVVDSATQLPKFEETQTPFKFNTRQRMISFKTIHRVNCPTIAKNSPMDKAILSSIVLQLSEDTRELLRQKMGYYFRRPP